MCFSRIHFWTSHFRREKRWIGNFPLKLLGRAEWSVELIMAQEDSRHSCSSDCIKMSARVTDTISDTDVWSKPQQPRDKKSLINFSALWIRPSLIGTCWSVVLLLPPFEKQSLWIWGNKKERGFCGCSKHSRLRGPLFTASSATLHYSLQSKRHEEGKRTEEWSHSAKGYGYVSKTETILSSGIWIIP